MLNTRTIKEGPFCIRCNEDAHSVEEINNMVEWNQFTDPAFPRGTG